MVRDDSRRHMPRSLVGANTLLVKWGISMPKTEYDSYIYTLPAKATDMPLVDGKPVSDTLMLYNWWMNDQATTTLEFFKVNAAGPSVGMLDEFAPEPFCGLRYYNAIRPFKSFPYKTTMNSIYLFMGMDPARPDYLGATIEAWMGEGEDAEQYIITKPGIWLTPPDILHGPFVVRSVEAPFLFLVCLTAPTMSMMPVKKWPPGFNYGEIDEQPFIENRKYAKYFSDFDPRLVAVPPSHENRVTPLMFYDAYTNPEVNRTIDCRMIREGDIGFGIGESTGEPMYDFSAWPHKHAFLETYSFVGLDPAHRGDLGGTIQFWIGEGSEAEECTITKPTTIILPKNTVHLPAHVEEVHNPFLMLSVVDMPIWGAKWNFELPPAFRHSTL